MVKYNQYSYTDAAKMSTKVMDVNINPSIQELSKKEKEGTPLYCVFNHPQ